MNELELTFDKLIKKELKIIEKEESSCNTGRKAQALAKKFGYKFPPCDTQNKYSNFAHYTGWLEKISSKMDKLQKELLRLGFTKIVNTGFYANHIEIIFEKGKTSFRFSNNGTHLYISGEKSAKSLSVSYYD